MPTELAGRPRTSFAGASSPQDRPRCETEVADNPTLRRDHEGAGRVHLLGHRAVTSKPAIELVDAGIEPGQVVVGVESLQAQPGSSDRCSCARASLHAG
jgi:hypothetical protein